MTLPYFTIGHSNRSLEEFLELLRGAGIRLVADVRTVSRSRANPQFNKDTLPAALAAREIAYEPLASLGGLRGKSKDVPAQVNGFWDNASFHNFADYALSEGFRAGLAQLIALGRERHCAMMCSEAVWWRCHRRIVADHLLARGETVIHVMGAGRLESARLTAGAVVQRDGTVVYPQTQARILLDA